MTERLHYDRVVVEPPLRLNPVTLATLLSRRHAALSGKFLTNVTVRYNPSVSTETAGTVAFGLSRLPDTTLQQISALSPNYVGSVWKPATLNIEKSLLNTQDWLTSRSASLYLVAHNSQGTFTITCTIRLLVTQSDKAYYTYDEYEQLPLLTTSCYVGPRLEGFSLACGAPDNLKTYNGNGVVINVDMTRATARTTRSSYGLLTPSSKTYLGVVFSLTGHYRWTFDSANRSMRWINSNHTLWSFNAQSPPTGAMDADDRGSSRVVIGSTAPWCWIESLYEYVNLSGTNFKFWYPYAVLVLYYYYPGVNIQNPDFRPSLRVHTRSLLPSPPGNAQPDKEQEVPLFMALMQALWSAYWHPDLDPLQKLQFTAAKRALEDWPTTEQN